MSNILNAESNARSLLGFTLIELAIVVMIIGLFTASFAQLAKQYYLEQKKEYQSKSLDEITESLADFVRDRTIADDPTTAIDETFLDTSVHYPCPADPSIAVGALNSGVEQRVGAPPYPAGAPCAVVGGIIRDDNGTPSDLTDDIYIGSIPTVTLGIPAKNMTDAYGYRYTYAVSHSISTSMALSGANPQGAITVRGFDNAGLPDPSTDITSVPFVIVSHGEDGAGAYTSGGNLVAGGCASAVGNNSENCNNDNIFYDGSLQHSIAGGAQDYNDTTIFSLTGLQEDDEYWALNPADSTEIYNVNTGNVGVGLVDAQAQLHVGGAGSLLVDDVITVNGVLSSGNQSTAQAASAQNNRGYIEAPWVYTHNIQTANERGGGGSGVALGRSTLPNGTDIISDQVSLYTGGDSRILVDASGNVGVGTMAPNSLLEIGDIGGRGDVNLAVSGGVSVDANVDSQPSISMQGRGLITSENHLYIGIDSDNDQSDTASLIFVKNINGVSSFSTADELMRVREDGTVGIGRQTPRSRLDVAGDIRVGWTGNSCGPNNEGAIRFESGRQRHTVCSQQSGTRAWRPIGSFDITRCRAVSETNRAPTGHLPTPSEARAEARCPSNYFVLHGACSTGTGGGVNSSISYTGGIATSWECRSNANLSAAPPGSGTTAQATCCPI